jgi:predicted anti-sigma-YlaC factor YlaD
MSAHLTNEELTDNLLGVSSLTVNAHLINCPACSSELERMKHSISDFRSAAQAWSESPQRTHNVVSAVSATSQGLWRSNWLLVAAAMIMFAVGLTFYVRNQQNGDQAAVAHVTAPGSATGSSQSQLEKDQLEKDNELLAQVDNELAEAVPMPMQPLRLVESNASSTSTGK